MPDEPHNEPTSDDAPTGPTEPMGSSEPPADEPRRLTRSGSDAVIGGVASGLGRYFGVDPILFRIGFVVLTFVGAIGILAYLALLAFVPTDGEQRPGGTSKTVATVGAVVLGCVLVTFLGTPVFFFGPGLLIVGLVGLAGYLLWRALGGIARRRPGPDGRTDRARRAHRRRRRRGSSRRRTCGCPGRRRGDRLARGRHRPRAGRHRVRGRRPLADRARRWRSCSRSASSPPPASTSTAASATATTVPATMTELRDTYDIGIGSMRVDLRDIDLPAGRDRPRGERRHRRGGPVRAERRLRDLGRADRGRRLRRARPRQRRRRRLVRQRRARAGGQAEAARQRRRRPRA